MDVMDDELLAFWRKLNENSVRNIMVGGLATRFHGFNRNTDDLDIWIENTLPNRQNFRKAFKELGYGDYSSIETCSLCRGGRLFTQQVLS